MARLVTIAGTDRLADFDAVDRWVRAVVELLDDASGRADAAALDCDWLVGRCRDTLRYDLRDSHVKWASFVHLIEEVERFAVEHDGLVPHHVAESARAIVHAAEQRRYSNG